jgi:hypothetical protein
MDIGQVMGYRAMPTATLYKFISAYTMQSWCRMNSLLNPTIGGVFGYPVKLMHYVCNHSTGHKINRQVEGDDYPPN